MTLCFLHFVLGSSCSVVFLYRIQSSVIQLHVVFISCDVRAWWVRRMMTRMKRRVRRLFKQMRRTKTTDLDYTVRSFSSLLFSSPSSSSPPSWTENLLHCYRCDGFTKNRQRENSCQILHLGHQGCCQVLSIIQTDWCNFMWSLRWGVWGESDTNLYPQRSTHTGGAVSLLSHQQIPAFQCSRVQ